MKNNRFLSVFLSIFFCYLLQFQLVSMVADAPITRVATKVIQPEDEFRSWKSGDFALTPSNNTDPAQVSLNQEDIQHAVTQMTRAKQSVHQVQLPVTDLGTTLMRQDRTFFTAEKHITPKAIEYLFTQHMMPNFASTAASKPLQNYFTVVPLEHVKGASIKGAFHILLNNRPIFFVKVVDLKNSLDEIRSLKNIQESTIGSFNKKMKNNQRAPILMSIEHIFLCTDGANKQFAIEFLHVAGKDSCLSLLDKALEAGDISSLHKCSYQIGQALGIFHKFFLVKVNPKKPQTWRSVNHGDFHHHNARVTCYDAGEVNDASVKKNKQPVNLKTILNKSSLKHKDYCRVYFIDSERMTRLPIHTDIFYFIFNFLIGWKALASIPDELWALFADHISLFLQGYVDAYEDLATKKILKNYLASSFKQLISQLLLFNQFNVDMVLKKTGLTSPTLETYALFDQQYGVPTVVIKTGCEALWIALRDDKSKSKEDLLKKFEEYDHKLNQLLSIPFLREHAERVTFE